MSRPQPDSRPAASSHSRCDPYLWASVLGDDDRLRQQAASEIVRLNQAELYARELLAALRQLTRRQRARAGEGLSLLGDPRFGPSGFLCEMLPVSAGRVILGSPDVPDERPVHAIEVGAFSLAQFPVVNAAYAAFIRETHHPPPRGWRGRKPPDPLLNAPVVYVSARDAEAYCAWLSAETGFHYRLPTEAEWVMAARGLDSRRTYPWGDEFNSEYLNAWTDQPLGQVCAVGLFPEVRGPFKHYDLAGNVWEWCSSLYWPYPYRSTDGREDPSSNDRRVMHGGSWRSGPISVRCAARQGEPPTDSFPVTGFRIARSGSLA